MCTHRYKKRKWSKSEITLLKVHWPLSGAFPLLKERKQYIEQCGMAKTAKNIAIPQMAPAPFAIINTCTHMHSTHTHI